MNEIFKDLIATTDLWLPALSWLLGQLSATGTGIKIDKEIKERLQWIKNPEAEKAFQEAFNTGIKSYQARQNDKASQAVAKILIHVAKHDTTCMDRAAILEQIFSPKTDLEAIRGLVSRHIFALEGTIISRDIVGTELQELIKKYLKPAFLKQRYFTEIVGFAEVIGLLTEIKDNTKPFIDFNILQKDYYQKIGVK